MKKCRQVNCRQYQKSIFVISRKASHIALKHFYTFRVLVFLYLAWLHPYTTFILPPLLRSYLPWSPMNYVLTWRVTPNEHLLTHRQSFSDSRRAQSFGKLRKYEVRFISSTCNNFSSLL